MTQYEQLIRQMPAAENETNTFVRNRRSQHYVRWLQRALNRVLPARLAVDGRLGPRTRATLRRFQRRAGLVTDGRAGPRTERALLRAGAPPLPGGRARPGRSSSLSTTLLKRNLVQLARREWRRWNRGRTKEGNPRMRSVLAAYWRRGAGWLPSGSRWWHRYPWSAAFISWLMRKAGAGHHFAYAAAHAHYIAQARENRRSGGRSPFQAFRTTEIAPEPGDLVCKRRQSGVTFDNVRRGHKTHCDVVTAVRPGHLITIGGNVRNSVSQTTVRTNADGQITDPRYFAIIRATTGR